MLDHILQQNTLSKICLKKKKNLPSSGKGTDPEMAWTLLSHPWDLAPVHQYHCGE